MPFPIPSSQNLQIPKKKQYQSPFKSSRRQKSVFRLRRNGRRDKERERKRNQAFKIKSGALLYSSFPRCSKAQSKTFWVSQMHLSLLSLCVGCWCSYKKKRQKKNTEEEEEEKKGRSFFFLKDVQNPKRTTHQKTVTSFFSSFFSSSSFRRHSFHRIFFEQTGLSFVWISLSLSLSLSLRRKRRARFLVVVVVVVLRALFLFVLLLKACDHIIGKTFFLSTT